MEAVRGEALQEALYNGEAGVLSCRAVWAAGGVLQRRVLERGWAENSTEGDGQRSLRSRWDPSLGTGEPPWGKLL